MLFVRLTRRRKPASMFDFATPLAFLLLPIPLLARLLLPPQSSDVGAIYLPASLADTAAPSELTSGARRVQAGLIVLLWLALITALAGPQRLVPTRDLTASGRDIILTLDMSGSMLTEDFNLDGKSISRLAAVKQVAARFVAERQGDRIGLVLFADRAYVAAPPTYEVSTVSRAIAEASIGITGRSTSIADGLGLALKRIVASDAETRVIVLLSDGRDTSNRLDARQVAALAASHGVRVHTIALGPDDLETRPGARDAVDTATLRAIAEGAGGTSYRVHGMDDLVAMAADLDRLEPNPSARAPVILPQPVWVWPALLALIAALCIGVNRRAEA